MSAAQCVRKALLAIHDDNERVAVRECWATEGEAMALSAAMKLVKGNIMGGVQQLRSSWNIYEKLLRNHRGQAEEEEGEVNKRSLL